ncbi:cyclin-dependent kinases regulatory subunit 2-like [Argopecten irradians]|uniref:cyclin-dependent kinases regulatory subunit 2-like n=1 Tax=Argopecten irradians TaxID=31199 RepID=UPI00371B2217
MAHKNIYYSDKYTDENYEYRYTNGHIPYICCFEFIMLNFVYLLNYTKCTSMKTLKIFFLISEPHILLFRRGLPMQTQNCS